MPRSLHQLLFLRGGGQGERGKRSNPVAASNNTFFPAFNKRPSQENDSLTSKPPRPAAALAAVEAAESFALGDHDHYNDDACTTEEKISQSRPLSPIPDEPKLGRGGGIRKNDPLDEEGGYHVPIQWMQNNTQAEQVALNYLEDREREKNRSREVFESFTKDVKELLQNDPSLLESYLTDRMKAYDPMTYRRHKIRRRKTRKRRYETRLKEMRSLDAFVPPQQHGWTTTEEEEDNVKPALIDGASAYISSGIESCSSSGEETDDSANEVSDQTASVLSKAARRYHMGGPGTAAGDEEDVEDDDDFDDEQLNKGVAIARSEMAGEIEAGRDSSIISSVQFLQSFAATTTASAVASSSKGKPPSSHEAPPSISNIGATRNIDFDAILRKARAMETAQRRQNYLDISENNKEHLPSELTEIMEGSKDYYDDGEEEGLAHIQMLEKEEEIVTKDAGLDPALPGPIKIFHLASNDIQVWACRKSNKAIRNWHWEHATKTYGAFDKEYQTSISYASREQLLRRIQRVGIPTPCPLLHIQAHEYLVEFADIGELIDAAISGMFDQLKMHDFSRALTCLLIAFKLEVKDSKDEVIRLRRRLHEPTSSGINLIYVMGLNSQHPYVQHEEGVHYIKKQRMGSLYLLVLILHH
eukprot:jgi/Bigna1/67066/fgenesh1_pg.3_\